MRLRESMGALALLLVFSACTPARAPGLAPAQPLPDSDADGIANLEDDCPGAKEDGKPPFDKDGCPADDDGDGIKGQADRCPDKAETFNGLDDTDGCPDEIPVVKVAIKEEKKQERVSVTGKQIKFDEEILFKTASAEIDQRSEGLLQEIARVFKDHPEIDFVEVAGHADKRGTAVRNKTLTQQRADSVVKWLGKNGVDARRLRPAGYGFYCPIDPGDSEAAYAKNRRVELQILRSGGKDLDDRWGGCAEAEKAGIKPQAIPAAAPRSAPVDAPAKTEERFEMRPAEIPPYAPGDEERRLSADCEGGKAPACVSLGLMVEGGNGALHSASKAQELHRKACDGKDWDGCANLGQILELSASADFKGALAAYSSACQSGNQQGCDGLGSLYQRGRGVAEDDKKALDLYLAACQGGVATSCEAAGMMYFNAEGAAQDLDMASMLLERACQWSYQRACAEWKKVEAARPKKSDAPPPPPTSAPPPAATGEAPPAPPPEPPKPAAKEKPCYIGEVEGCTYHCDKGDGHACVTLGVTLTYGINTSVDLPSARVRFQAAAQKGTLRGGVHLGLLMEKGLGGGVDVDGALKLYTQACEGREWVGCTNLGILQFKGLGAAKDEARALASFSLACGHGEAIACEWEALFNYKGLGGLKVDIEKATHLAKIGCFGGGATSCELYGRLLLNPEISIDLDVPAGVDSLALGCKRGSEAACRAQAELNTCWLGDPNDCVKLCDQGNNAACFAAGRLYLNAKGSARSQARAELFFRKAYRGAVRPACADDKR